MRGLHLYAVLSESPGSRLGGGILQEPLSTVEVADLHVVTGEMRDRPPLSPSLLRRHDETIRRLMSSVNAVLPFRYGEWASPDALERIVTGRADDFRSLLRLVEGCDQMTLRILGPDVEPSMRPASAQPRGGPGTRYLARRMRRAAMINLVLAPLRAGLNERLRAERIERHGTGRLLASVYHLVQRAHTGTYTATVEQHPREDVRVLATGPWPPYAFVEK